MQLIVCDCGTYDDPREVKPGIDDAYIAQRLRKLFDEGGDDRFMILADEDKEPGNEGYFIQVYFDSPDFDDDDEEDDEEDYDDVEEEGFALEYRDGSEDKHYQCLSVLKGSLGFFEVTKAFLSYLHGTEEWRTAFDWRIAEWREEE